MFTPSQLKIWTSAHLQACPCYLECNKGITPVDEETLFQKLNNAVDVEPEFDEFSGLGANAQAKAMKRRETSD